MKGRWKTIEAWLEENAPEVGRGLEPPTSEAEITTAESAMRVRLPPWVRAAYLIHDGESVESDGLFGLWRLLPLQEVVEVARELATLSDQYGFDDFDSHLMIPILESSGDHYYVESSIEGEETPVIEWWQEDPSRDVKAASFAQFVDAFIARLTANQYLYEPGGLQGLIDIDEL